MKETEMKETTNAPLSFEDCLARLEAIVKTMEAGTVPLAQMLSLFEEGTGLVKTCSAMLSEAEQKVVLLTQGKDGAYHESDFKPLT